MHDAMSLVDLALYLHVMLATVVIRIVNPLMIQHSRVFVHIWQKIAITPGAKKRCLLLMQRRLTRACACACAETLCLGS